VKEEIIEKLVTNLNYTIDNLNGKNALKLKVKNMLSLKFDPKSILKSIITMYIALKPYEVFRAKVVEDERSFSIAVFQKTLDILIK